MTDIAKFRNVPTESAFAFHISSSRAIIGSDALLCACIRSPTVRSLHPLSSRACCRHLFSSDASQASREAGRATSRRLPLHPMPVLALRMRVITIQTMSFLKRRSAYRTRIWSSTNVCTFSCSPGKSSPPKTYCHSTGTLQKSRRTSQESTYADILTEHNSADED